MKTHTTDSSDDAVMAVLDLITNSSAVEVAPFDPGKNFSSRFLLQMSKRLSMDEIGILLRAEFPREEGLSFARSGDRIGSLDRMRESRRIYAGAGLSIEAFHAGETFQQAAESYCQYKVGDHEAAWKAMMASIDSSRILNDDYGYNMQFRRIHLMRNLVRVLFSAQGSSSSVLDQCMDLLFLVIEDRTGTCVMNLAAWCSDHGMTEREMLWCLDEVILELLLVCGKASDKQAAMLKLSNCVDRGRQHHVEHEIVWSVLACERLYLAGDRGSFFLLLDKFLRSDHRFLPSVRKELLRLFNLVRNTNSMELASEPV